MNRYIAAVLIGAAAFAAQPVSAQEVDDIGPGVDTTAAMAADEIGPGVDTSAAMTADDIGPGADTSAAPDDGDSDAPAVANVAPAANTNYRPGAVDSLALGSSQIIGNQELPQVLYIVPWKSSDLGDLVGRPVNTLLDEVLAPADREVFIRQIEYYDDIHGAATDDQS